MAADPILGSREPNALNPQRYEESSTRKIAKGGQRPVRVGAANFIESKIRKIRDTAAP